MHFLESTLHLPVFLSFKMAFSGQSFEHNVHPEHTTELIFAFLPWISPKDGTEAHRINSSLLYPAFQSALPNCGKISGEASKNLTPTFAYKSAVSMALLVSLFPSPKISLNFVLIFRVILFLFCCFN